MRNNAPVEWEGARKGEAPSMEELKALYIPLDAPDAARFFTSLGTVYRWSSTGETLFFFSSGRNIYFDGSSCWSTYRGRESRGGAGFVKDGGRTYISLGELFGQMNIALRRGEKDDSIAILPVIDDIYWQEEMKTREFMLHGTAPMESRVEEYSDRRLVLFFPHADTTLPPGEQLFTDLPVTVEKAMSPLPGVRATITFPEHWHGKFMGSRMTGESAVEMIPRFPLTPGYRYERLTSLSARDDGGKRVLELTGTGPMQYLWSCSPEKNLLTVDLPLLEVPADTGRLPRQEGPITDFRCLSFDRLYGVTRLYITLAPGTKFLFEKEKKSPYMLRLVFSAGQQGASLSGRDVTGEAENWGTIVLDPGHGGCDPGAVSRALGLTEKEVNLDVALRLARILERCGWKVVLTRTTDRDVSWANSPDRVELQARVDVARVNGATIFISIHCNASVYGDTRGSSLHWNKTDDLELARALAVSTELFQQELGIPQRGIVESNFYVLRYSSMPALLVEMAHISNVQEATIFADPGCRQRLAEAMARGIERYFLGKGFRKKGQ